MLYEVTLGPLQLTEITLWIISMVCLVIVGILFVKDYRKNNNIYFFWLSLYFFLFTIARSLRLIVKFYIGEPAWSAGQPAPELTGMAWILESAYTILSYIGLFFIYYAMESTFIKKTHYFFSIWVWVVTAISLIDFVTRTLTAINVILFLVLVMGLPVIFLNLAIKSSGSVRKNALIVFVGILLFILSVGMDIPDGKVLFGVLPAEVLAIVPPVCAITSCYFFRRGFKTEM